MHKSETESIDPPKEPLTSLPGFSRISARAQRALIDSGATVDPMYRVSADRVTEILGLPPSPMLDAVLAVHRDFGGLNSPLLYVRPSWYNKRDGIKETAAGEVAVPIGKGRSPSSKHGGRLYFVTTDGVICRSDAHMAPAVAGWASIDKLLEKLVVLLEVEPLRPGSLRLTFTPRIGAQLAAALNALPIAAATDCYHAFWESDQAVVGDGDPYASDAEASTRVWPSGLETAARAMRAAHAIGSLVQLYVERGCEKEDEPEPTRHQSTEAPALASIWPRGEAIVYPSKTLDRGQEVWAWLASRDGDSTIHQVWVDQGRVYRHERFTAHGYHVDEYTIDFSSLRPHLSARANARLEHVKTGRDPSETCTRAELEDLLRRLDLPVHEQVLDFQEAIGGVGSDDFRFGTFSAVRGFAKGDVHLTEWLPLLPIVSAKFGLMTPFDMDAQGRVHIVDPDIMESKLLADSWQVLLERWYGLPSQVGADGYEPIRLEISGLFGATLATCFGAELYEAASDSVQRIWEASGVIIIEDATDWPSYALSPKTQVRGGFDTLASAMKAVHAVDPLAAMRLVGAFDLPAPAPHAAPIFEVPLWKARSARPEDRIRVFGEPGNYGFLETVG